MLYQGIMAAYPPDVIMNSHENGYFLVSNYSRCKFQSGMCDLTEVCGCMCPNSDGGAGLSCISFLYARLPVNLQ
jgi:hypothetical protein